MSKVGIEDSDGQQVEVEGLQTHPGEDTEQKVVENGSSDPAGGWGALGAAPHIDQEGKIQEKQADAQSHVDLRGIFRLEPLQREPEGNIEHHGEGQEDHGDGTACLGDASESLCRGQVQDRPL